MNTVKIGIDDPMCRGVTSADGKREYAAHDHVVEVPAYEARGILGTPMASRYRQTIAANRPLMPAHRAYDEYVATHEWMPYMQWYRENWEGKQCM